MAEIEYKLRAYAITTIDSIIIIKKKKKNTIDSIIIKLPVALEACDKSWMMKSLENSMFNT
jgi:hypothetical protein